jgi:O-antigen/teichoic acid export membrane protein
MTTSPGPNTDVPHGSIAKSSTALLAGNIGAGLLALVFAILVAKSLGPSGRGIVAFATTVTITVSWLSLMGLEVAFSFYCGARRDLRPAIVSSAIFSGAVTGIVGAAIGWLILSKFPHLTPSGIPLLILVVSLGTTPLASIQRLFNATLVGSGRIAAANVIVLGMPATAVVAFLALGTIFGRTATTAVAAWAISRALGSLASIALGGHMIGFGDRASIREAMRLALRYGLRAYPGSIAAQPVRRLDTFVLAAVAPSAQLGFYAAAVNMSEVGMYLPNAVASVLLPTSAGMSERDAAKAVHRASALVLTLVVVGALAGIVLAEPLITGVLGHRFVSAVGPFRLMLVAMIGGAARRTFCAGLMAKDRAGVVSWITLATMVVIVVLDLALIPRYEAMGAAAASMVAYCASGIVAYVAYRRFLHPETLKSLPPLRHEIVEAVRELRVAIGARRGRRAAPVEAETGSAPVGRRDPSSR